MAVRRMEFGATLPLLFLAVAVPGYSVTIQYSGGFGTGSGDFTGVARITSGLGNCSGALMADGMHVMTAAHCAASISVDGLSQTVLTPITPFLSFFTPSFSSGFADTVTGVHLNPATTAWFSGDPTFGLMYDIAVLDLATPAPSDATRYNLDLSGFAIANQSAVLMAGWGLGGFPGGAIGGTAGDRRGGTNKVSGVFTSANDPSLPGNPSVSLLDQPIELQWTTTGDTSTPTNTLGLSNAGDSGGPLLYNGNLIGITSFGDLPRDGTLPIGLTFADGYANLSNRGNADFLNSLGLAATPEPGTWMLAAGGTLLVMLRLRDAPVGLFQ
jgi:Trypsin